jgi:hypothetical protein
LSEEDDIEFTDIIIPEDKIIIWMPETILETNFGNDKENVRTLWRTERDKKYDKIQPLEILELARDIFHQADIKDKVVIDISKIKAWKVLPSNPEGFCSIDVQGILVGNVGFFVSLIEIGKMLINRLKTMDDNDKKEYLEAFLRLLKNTPPSVIPLSNPDKKALKDLIEQILANL